MTEKEQYKMFEQNKENIKWGKLLSLGFIMPHLPLKQDKKIFQLMNLLLFLSLWIISLCETKPANEPTDWKNTHQKK